MFVIPDDFQDAALTTPLYRHPETGSLGMLLTTAGGHRLHVALPPDDLLMLKDALDGIEPGRAPTQEAFDRDRLNTRLCRLEDRVRKLEAGKTKPEEIAAAIMPRVRQEMEAHERARAGEMATALGIALKDELDRLKQAQKATQGSAS
jgi:hypothetical protein